MLSEVLHGKVYNDSNSYFIFNCINLFLCVWVFCLYVCLCTTFMLSVHEGQMKVLDPLRPELKTVVGHLIDSGNRT